MSIVIGLCHDSREIIETFSESVESSYHMIARNWWSCDRQDSVRSLNEVTVMAMKASAALNRLWKGILICLIMTLFWIEDTENR